MEKKRSAGVTLFGIIFVIWVIFPVLWIITNFLFTARYGTDGPYDVSVYFDYIANFIYILLLIATGIGLIRLKSWSRKTVLFLFVPLYMIIMPYFQFIELEKLPHNAKTSIAMNLVILRIVYAVILLVYFTRPKVKEQFK